MQPGEGRQEAQSPENRTCRLELRPQDWERARGAEGEFMMGVPYVRQMDRVPGWQWREECQGTFPRGVRGGVGVV